jgi:SAM-dependent methyltransferase
MAQYGKPDYWENRYLKDPDPFDWYQRYNGNPNLQNLLVKTIPQTAAILVPGCGSSRLSEDMLKDGYTGGISNIDISRTAIDLMAERCKDMEGLTCAWPCVRLQRLRLACVCCGGGVGTLSNLCPIAIISRSASPLRPLAHAHFIFIFFFSRPLPFNDSPPLSFFRFVPGQVMNCCSLGYPDASFDAVIDKATLDSLLCGENSTANTGRYVGEVCRVLKPGGVFIVVSFGTPENRLSYLEGEYGWQTTVHSIPKPTINAAGLPQTNTSDPNLQHVSCAPIVFCPFSSENAPHAHFPLVFLSPFPSPPTFSTFILQLRNDVP